MTWVTGRLDEDNLGGFKQKPTTFHFDPDRVFLIYSKFNQIFVKNPIMTKSEKWSVSA